MNPSLAAFLKCEDRISGRQEAVGAGAGVDPAALAPDDGFTVAEQRARAAFGCRQLWASTTATA